NERSPNYRYTAVAVRPQCNGLCYQRRLIDLETKTVQGLLDDGGGPPGFQWTHDSRYLCFKGGGDSYRYDTQTGHLGNLGNKLQAYNSEVEALVNNDTEWLSALKDKVSRYHLESGELISRHTLDDVEMVSPDKEYL